MVPICAPSSFLREPLSNNKRNSVSFSVTNSFIMHFELLIRIYFLSMSKVVNFLS